MESEILILIFFKFFKNYLNFFLVVLIECVISLKNYYPYLPIDPALMKNNPEVYKL